MRNITDAGRHGTAVDVVQMVTRLIDDVNQNGGGGGNASGHTEAVAAALAAGTIPPVRLWLDPASVRAVCMPDAARDLQQRLLQEAEEEEQRQLEQRAR